MLKILLLVEVAPPKMGVVAAPGAGLTPKMLVLLLERLPKIGVALEEVSPNVDVLLPKILLPVELAEGLLNKLVLVLELPNSPPVDVPKILNGAVVDGVLAVVLVIEKEKVLMALALLFVMVVGVAGAGSSACPGAVETGLSSLEGFSNKSLKVSDFVGWAGVKLKEVCSFGVPNVELAVEGVTFEGVVNIVALLLLSF